MSVKLSVNSNSQIVTPKQMKDGQIGEILRWGNSPSYIGRIIQKHGESVLVGVGEKWGHRFPNAGDIDKPEYQIRLLQPGETIEIVQNDG